MTNNFLAKWNRKKFKKESVESYMTNWLETVKKPSLKRRSYDRIEQSLQYQVFPEIGDIPLKKLTTNDIQRMLNKISEERSYSTAKKAYDNINACLNLAVIKGELISNPVLGAVLPKNKVRSDVSSYTEEQVRLIANEAVSLYKNGNVKYRYGYALILILNTGMRVGEALYLRWKDVNLEKRHIYVHGNVSVVKTHDKDGKSYELIEQDSPKTDKSNRYISLNDNAVNALINLRKIIGDSSRVIATSNGTITSPHKIYDTMKRILEHCEIYGAVDIVHALRHTFATMLIRQGEDIKVVSELLGHSDVSTTIRIYYHTIEEQKHSAVQKLNNFY